MGESRVLVVGPCCCRSPRLLNLDNCTTAQNRVMFCLRHYVITSWLRAGIPVHVVQRMAGHTNLSTTQRYVPLPPRLPLPHPRATFAAHRNVAGVVGKQWTMPVRQVQLIGEPRTFIDIHYKNPDGSRARFRKDAEVQTLDAVKAEEQQFAKNIEQFGEPYVPSTRPNLPDRVDDLYAPNMDSTMTLA